ncbi:hypothetical protein DEO72_LG1g2463 [Vigna unguiculata]|uniref:Uncharacterized protein n=1 Tax=Vigna unguiculata TaxID=3917 RepID=A0A4D6KST7_VIGUN|nr:hypothetical protein DEO72_LG1g2463 [Vigna unguiculata]
MPPEPADVAPVPPSSPSLGAAVQKRKRERLYRAKTRTTTGDRAKTRTTTGEQRTRSTLAKHPAGGSSKLTGSHREPDSPRQRETTVVNHDDSQNHDAPPLHSLDARTRNHHGFHETLPPITATAARSKQATTVTPADATNTSASSQQHHWTQTRSQLPQNATRPGAITTLLENALPLLKRQCCHRRR